MSPINTPCVRAIHQLIMHEFHNVVQNLEASFLIKITFFAWFIMDQLSSFCRWNSWESIKFIQFSPNQMLLLWLKDTNCRLANKLLFWRRRKKFNQTFLLFFCVSFGVLQCLAAHAFVALAVTAQVFVIVDRAAVLLEIGQNFVATRPKEALASRRSARGRGGRGDAVEALHDLHGVRDWR